MKRYMALLADMEAAGYLVPEPDGDWVKADEALAEIDRWRTEALASRVALGAIAKALVEKAHIRSDYVGAIADIVNAHDAWVDARESAAGEEST